MEDVPEGALGRDRGGGLFQRRGSDGRWLLALFDLGPRPDLHGALKTVHSKVSWVRRAWNSLRLPPRSPNLNAFAERFVRSIKQECLHHILPLGEGHLRRTVGEFVAHYHSERSPGPGQSHSVSRSSTRGRARSYPPARTPWRTPQLLRTIGRLNCDLISGQNGSGLHILSFGRTYANDSFGYLHRTAKTILGKACCAEA